MLVHNDWPSQHEVPHIDGFPGAAGWSDKHLTLVRCPWVLYYEKSKVDGIVINKLVAESLTRILESIWEDVGKTQDAIEKLHYHKYSGSFNYRHIRGGSGLSMHAYGRAIDWDDAENQQHSQKHLFTDESLIVRAFKAEGWIWGGDWQGSSIDPMHFQAARVG